MFIYDRRRCRPMDPAQMRARLSLVQRAKLGELESAGWKLRFVRGTAAAAFISHPDQGHALLSYTGRVVRVRELPVRSGGDAAPSEDALFDELMEGGSGGADAPA